MHKLVRVRVGLGLGFDELGLELAKVVHFTALKLSSCLFHLKKPQVVAFKRLKLLVSPALVVSFTGFKQLKLFVSLKIFASKQLSC